MGCIEQKLGSGVTELKKNVLSPFLSNLTTKNMTETKQIHGKL